MLKLFKKNYLKKNNLKKIEWFFETKNCKNKRILSWELFGDCNFNCKKCFQNRYRSKSIIHFNEIDKLYDNSKKVYNFCKINNFRRIEILGGEPTLLECNSLLKILSPFKEEKELILNLYSNFSREPSYFFPLFNELKNVKLELTLAFHEKKMLLKEYISKLLILLKEIKEKKYNVKIIMQFTINDNNDKIFKELYNIYNSLKINNNIKLSIHEELKMDKKHRVISSFNYFKNKNIKENEKYIKFFNRNKKYILTYKNNKKTFSLIDRDILSFKGSYCYTDAYTINFLGNLTNICGNHIYIKNFYNKKNINLDKIKNKIKCKSNFCCSSFYKVTGEKND